MSLAFLVPAFLIGLGVIAIPIFVHLRQRERNEPIRFPSLMFLRQLPHKTTERRRLTHRLLLLLRALAVALLVAAFGRPFLKRADNRPVMGTERRAVVVVLDRSMSMGYRGVWERARDSALAAISDLRSGDRAALIGFDESPSVVAPLATDLGPFRTGLAGLLPSGQGTRYAPALRAALEVAGQARGIDPEVVLITDLQRNATVGLESIERPAGTNLRVIHVGPTTPANSRVVDVEVDQRAAGRQARLQVSARVATKSGTPIRTTASLVVAGRVLANLPVTLKPNGLQSIRFDPVTIPATEATAMVALGSDDLPADDTLRFTLGAATGVQVALLLPPGMGSDESLYLERALAISRAPTIAVRTHRGTALSDADLADVRAVVLADGGSLTPRGADGIRRFVARGGGAVVFAGRRGSISTDRAGWLPARLGRVIDRSADRGARLGPLDGDHPIFEPFKDAIASDFGAVRFFRYRELTPDSAGIVLGRFDDGRPAIVEGRAPSSGRVVLLAAPADALWSDFPLQPVFLPTIQRLVAHAAGLVEAKRWFAVGEVGSLPPEPIGLTIDPPAGPTRRVGPDSTRTIAFADPGFYQALADAAATPVVRFAVNTAAAESDLASVAPGEIAALLRVSTDSTQAEPGRLTVAEQEQAQSWWIVLLAVALVLLAVEMWYGSRLQGRERLVEVGND